MNEQLLYKYIYVFCPEVLDKWIYIIVCFIDWYDIIVWLIDTVWLCGRLLYKNTDWLINWLIQSIGAVSFLR